MRNLEWTLYGWPFYNNSHDNSLCSPPVHHGRCCFVVIFSTSRDVVYLVAVFPLLICHFVSILDFGSLFELEHDLPDELISSNDTGLINGGDLSQLHNTVGGGPAGLGSGGGGGPGGMGLGLGPGGGPGSVGGNQDAVAKHKQLSELLRAGAPTATQQGHQGAMGSPGGPTTMGQHLANIKASPGQGPPQIMGQGQQQHLSPQQQANMMQQQNAAAGMLGGMNRAMICVQQKGNNGQQQPGMMGNQVMNGSPRMGFGNQAVAGNSNLLAETLQQQGPGQGGMRGQQPGAMNKVMSTFVCLFVSPPPSQFNIKSIFY